ncbi:MAG: ABC transporter substrate-binding protein [Candidatus Synoicihabitans palmerolidicus]|nr:ABC transporter substrate-binding protein [Candidatus Synoicihabitans palmerolidicus]
MTRPFRIGHAGFLCALPLLHAKHQGYLDSEGLKIDLHRELGLRTLKQRCIEDRLDAACLPALTPVVQSHRYPQPENRWTVLAAQTRGGYGLVLSPGAMVRLKTPKYSEPYQLRIGIPPTSTPAPQMVSSWHKSLNSLHLSNPKCIHLPLDQMNPFMQEGVVDGFCAPDPMSAIAHFSKLGTLVANSTSLVSNHISGVITCPPGSRLLAPTPRQLLLRALEKATKECDVMMKTQTLPAWVIDELSPYDYKLDLKLLRSAKHECDQLFSISFASPIKLPEAIKPIDQTFVEDCCFALPGGVRNPRQLRRVIEEIYLASA